MDLHTMREWKRILGYSNQKLAQESGVPLGTVQKVLSGATESPRYKTLLALEQALERGMARQPKSESSTSTYPTPISSASATADISRTGASVFKEGNLAVDYTYSAGDHPHDPADIIEDAHSRRWRRQGTYTVRDYEAIPDEVRTELIDGVIFDMGSPSSAHQIIAGAVFNALFSHRLAGGADKENCMPFQAPIDVQLDCDDKTIVQPDVLVYCRKDDRDISKRLWGAPTFVMEVVSPSSRRRDMLIKTRKYADAGVQEYWIVDPAKETVTVYDFAHDDYPIHYNFDDSVPVLISGGELSIDFSAIRALLYQYLG